MTLSEAKALGGVVVGSEAVAPAEELLEDVPLQTDKVPTSRPEEEPSFIKSMFDNIETKEPDITESIEPVASIVPQKVETSPTIVDNVIPEKEDRYKMPTYQRRKKAVSDNEWKVFEKRRTFIDKMDDVDLQNQALELFSEKLVMSISYS